MASSGSDCPAAALSVPAGPCGIANSARHEQQVSGSARRHGHGPLSSPVPTVPKNALFAGVPGTRSSVPSSAPAISGLVFPVVTAPGQPRSRCSRQDEPEHEVPQLFQGNRAERVPPVPGRPRRRRPPRPRPRHQGQVPGQRGDHVPDPRLRHQRHHHDHPDHEGPGQKPFPPPLHEPGIQRRPPGDPAGGTRPGLRFQPFLQRSQRRVMHRAALRPDLPVPLDLRLRDRDHLAEHHAAARADPVRRR
jgi:hypothetical protein